MKRKSHRNASIARLSIGGFVPPLAARWVAIFVTAILLPTPFAAKGAPSSAETVTQWSFEQSNDVNYDNWPDNWRRRQGPQYPAYLSIEIVPKSTELMEAAIRADHQFAPYRKLAEQLGMPRDWLFAERMVDRYLRVQLNGGAAVVQSPPIAVDSIYSYRFVGSIFTQGLQHDSAWIEFLFVDASGEVLATHATPKFSGDTEWTQIALPTVPPPQDAANILVRLHVQPRGEADIYGEAGFDNIRIERLPQLQVTTDQPRGLYAVGQSATATCHVSGLAEVVTRLRFRLQGPQGEALSEYEAPLDDATAKHLHGPMPATDGSAAKQTLTQSWQLPKLGPGFYRVYVDLYAQETQTHTATATLAVLEELTGQSGPFGWTLGSGHDPISRRELPQWLHSCGVGWVKYPCWLDPTDTQGADDLAWMMERLQERGMKSVGMLDQPPHELRTHNDPRTRKPLAPLLRDPTDWQPQLEALLTRLSMRTTWWQIGGEGDHSFLRHPNLADTVDEIRRELQGFGQPIRVALSWPWLDPSPNDSTGGWKAICLTENEPYTTAELDANLQAMKSDALEKWITLDPLDAGRYRLEDRIRDLVGRMLTVRRHQVPVAFISDPFDSKLGVLNPDATPGEMLLPWRTTATLIGGLQHEGSLQMPNRSENVVMSDGERAVMVVWNTTPTEERIYLGEGVKQVDVWGRSKDVATDEDGRQIVSVETLPTFLVNVHPAVAKFRLAADLQPTRLESLPGRQQTLQLRLRNTFDSALTGRFTVQTPITWDSPPQPTTVNVAEDAIVDATVDVALRSNAAIGRERVRFDFLIDVEKRLRFSIWRDLDVGPEDIQIDPSIRFDPSGALVVSVNLINLSDRQQDYNCYMLTQSQTRRHQRNQLTVGPQQQVSKDFVWDNGKELLGTTMTLQAEDRNSKRVLIYPIVIEH
ncbi:hypothetical protein Poly24_50700 [Rosistilla carotiformis]|uniref:Alpha-galactosidase NEW3 domain-containing protein n=1 Tax=Rosistilla carotiformis TaxID=2528017 RepID=A0A518K0Q2_9BACT|nr:hypothetical protein [Rosistilla carotiformis]QDV71335.1 hypothetical protein Poly24_50700 [Rosistilla carotiformis]